MDKEEGDDSLPTSKDVAVELEETHDPSVEHFFVDVDLLELHQQVQMVAGDPYEAAVDSVMQFLALAIPLSQVRSNTQEEALDFSKSLMLTSEQYINVVSRKKQA